jgi:DNA-binding response OmpR family regulator
MKIAIVEDDKLLALNIWKKLKRNWYDIVISNSVEDFKKTILSHADLFIIDLGLWKESWFDIIKWLREEKKSNSPIIIMSGYADIDKKLKWFTMGVDDYICKPVIPEELVARVTALLRRWTYIKRAKVEYKDIIFDFELKEAYRWNEKLWLTRKELQIVEYFLLNKSRVVKKKELIKSIWGNIDLLDVTYNTINVTICKIRKKLWDEFELDTIQWVWYILN